MLGILSAGQIDALREVVTIGAGNAVTALSQMIKKKIDIAVPDVKIMPVEESGRIFGESTTLVSAVYLQMLGDLTGVIFFTMGNSEAVKFAELLTGIESTNKDSLDELGASSIQEVATILSGAYLSAISKMLKMRVLLSAPGLATDMAGAVVDAVLAGIGQEADFAIIVDTEINIVGEKIMTYFFFIPDEVSITKMTKNLGVD